MLGVHGSFKNIKNKIIYNTVLWKIKFNKNNYKCVCFVMCTSIICNIK
jgi:hypothetical protein